MSVGDIRPLTTCHPLCSTDITPLPRYYGTIRLLFRHRSFVVSFWRPTALADLKRSLGVRLSDFSPSPPSLLPGHDRISGVVLARTLAQARQPRKGSLAFGSAIRFQLPSHTPSRGRRFRFMGPSSPRAAAFRSWLPPIGPTEDSHLRSLNHAQRTCPSMIGASLLLRSAASRCRRMT